MVSILYFTLGVFVGIVGTIAFLVLSYERYKKNKGDKDERKD